MDASRKIPGSIHDEKLIIQFYRRCPDNWVHIKNRTAVLPSGYRDSPLRQQLPTAPQTIAKEETDENSAERKEQAAREILHIKKDKEICFIQMRTDNILNPGIST